jgi:DNA-binding IscR family transcriptional regulator
MSRSTKLVTAAYILSYVAAKHPEQVTTEAIAKAVDDHPARVRQIVAALVRAAFLASTRGAAGGVMLARPAAKINMRQVYEALADQPIVALGLRSFAAPREICMVEENFSNLYRELETKALEELARHRLDKMFSR